MSDPAAGWPAGPAGRTALVTGGGGFVGGHLVEALLGRGWEVRCLVRRSVTPPSLQGPGIEIVRGDVADHSPEGAATLERAARGTAAVFHLAAVTSAASDAEYVRVNERGTARVAMAAARAAPDAILVLCSSLAAAGPAERGRPLREGDAERPISAYGRSKLAAERALAASGVRHAVVRPPAVYGPRDADILAAFRLAARGLALRIAPPGQRLSMIHARDLATGMAAAAEMGGRGVYYMSDGVVHTWEDIIASIAAAVGRPVRVIGLPRAAATLAAHANRTVARITGRKPLLTADRVREMVQPEWTCDDARARRELGHLSPTTLDAGLRETAAWYRAHGWL